MPTGMLDCDPRPVASKATESMAFSLLTGAQRLAHTRYPMTPTQLTTEISMPQLGESVTEGTVGRWIKHSGDPVQKYEPLLEVITDKVDTEVPAPATGTLLEVLVPAGQTVPVGTVLARIVSVDLGADRDPPTQPTVERNTFISPVVARLLAEHGLD
ncbi:MAG: hypothetical protein HGA65_20270, partial [Oscillochloris sp.]|nr:hypothetical protein [Oscillochloris sp.]